MPKAKTKTQNHNAIVVMRHVKTTKNTHVYELDEDLSEGYMKDGKPICKTVYLMKDALPDPPPEVIQQTISYEE